MTARMFLRRAASAVARRTVGEEARRRRHFRGIAKRSEERGFLFVSGPGGDSARYRCRHPAEALRLLRMSADVGYHDELDLESLVDRYWNFVLYRVPWDERVERFLARARERGKKVIADVDDLVFDPGRAHLLHELSQLDSDERRRREATMARLGQTLASVDGVVASTEPLARAAAAFNPRVAVAPNAVSAEMVAAARRARRERRTRVVVAYLSGTSTHDRDFLEAADAVLAVLDRFAQVEFWAAGFLSLDERFDAYGDRVVRVPYTHWRRLPRLIAQIDVSLAPLEAANEFTEAKSALKYLEAGLLAVPTIASPTSDFRRVIETGRNGMLAATAGEWQHALAELVESEELRARMGEEARRDVLAHHTTAARAVETHAALMDALGRPPRVE